MGGGRFLISARGPCRTLGVAIASAAPQQHFDPEGLCRSVAGEPDMARHGRLRRPQVGAAGAGGGTWRLAGYLDDLCPVLSADRARRALQISNNKSAQRHPWRYHAAVVGVISEDQ